MALVPANYTGLILANSAFIGPQAAQMANGISIGFTTYLVSHPMNIIASLDAGAPGAGLGIGAVIPATCAAPTLQGILETFTRGAGLIGPQISQLNLGLAVATCTYLATAQTITGHAAVGAGTGVGSFIGVEPAGLGAQITAFTGFAGAQWAQMVSGISTALATFLLTNVKYQIAIAGPAGPGAATGAGFGRII